MGAGIQPEEVAPNKKRDKDEEKKISKEDTFRYLKTNRGHKGLENKL